MGYFLIKSNQKEEKIICHKKWSLVIVNPPKIIYPNGQWSGFRAVIPRRVFRQSRDFSRQARLPRDFSRQGQAAPGLRLPGDFSRQARLPPGCQTGPRLSRDFSRQLVWRVRSELFLKVLVEVLKRVRNWEGYS